MCTSGRDDDGDGICDEQLDLTQFSSPPETVLVEAASPMSYLANLSDPGVQMSWVAEGFDDSGWPQGVYGVGYETNTGVEDLAQTIVPTGSVSVFTRTTFEIGNVTDVSNLFLGVDYDDAYVAWINGVEVFRSAQVPAGPMAWDTAVAGHESSNASTPDYTPLTDISTAIPALRNGTNLLAIGVWNAVPAGRPSSDLVLVPRLSINRPAARNMSYLANTVDPTVGTAWVAPEFDDSNWALGNYGVGYETGNGAQRLIHTVVPTGTYSVYTRIRFTVDDPSSVVRMLLGADYDDGYVAWVNGIEIYRSPEIPSGDPAWNTNAVFHESSNGHTPDYGPMRDVAEIGLPALRPGENVVAIGVWNEGAPDSSDLVLVPRLTINGTQIDNCPGVPNLDQIDSDLDGLGDACDCDSTNDQVWAAPDEARGLTLTHDDVGGRTTLTWAAPLVFGSTQVRYDTLRSTDPADFLLQGLCVETDSATTTSTDVENPLPGTGFYYLVRSENDCPTGGGNPGSGSYGYPRSVPQCP